MVGLATVERISDSDLRSRLSAYVTLCRTCVSIHLPCRFESDLFAEMGTLPSAAPQIGTGSLPIASHVAGSRFSSFAPNRYVCMCCIYMYVYEYEVLCV